MKPLHKYPLPKCHTCGYPLDAISYWSGDITTLTHRYKPMCGSGMTKGSPDKQGIMIPLNCIKCGGDFSYYTGHIFHDHLTVLCEACMDKFEDWKQKNPSQCVARNFFIKYREKQVKFFNPSIREYKIGRVANYQFNGRILVIIDETHETLAIWPHHLEVVPDGQ